jgi:hypothetical protein
MCCYLISVLSKTEGRVSYSKEVPNNSILTVRVSALTPRNEIVLTIGSQAAHSGNATIPSDNGYNAVYLNLHSQGNSFLEKVGHVQSKSLASLDPDTAVAAPRANQTVGCLGRHAHDAHIPLQPL